MTTILAAMVSPEKPGARGSRWLTIENDTIIITNKEIHECSVRDLRLQGYTVEYVPSSVALSVIAETLS